MRKVILKVTTGGALGTMAFKISTDNEGTWSDAYTSLATPQYYHLVDGIYVKFEGTFVANDKWEIHVVGDEYVTNPQLKSAILRVNK